jgi:hypothetical protein
MVASRIAFISEASIGQCDASDALLFLSIARGMFRQQRP